MKSHLKKKKKKIFEYTNIRVRVSVALFDSRAGRLMNITAIRFLCICAPSTPFVTFNLIGFIERDRGCVSINFQHARGYISSMTPRTRLCYSRLLQVNLHLHLHRPSSCIDDVFSFRSLFFIFPAILSKLQPTVATFDLRHPRYFFLFSQT